MVKDILLGEDYEVVMTERDVASGDAGVQTCGLLADTCTGEWKNSPLSGWNMRSYVAAPKSELRSLKPRIMEDLKRNNISGSVRVEGDNIQIDLEL